MVNLDRRWVYLLTAVLVLTVSACTWIAERVPGMDNGRDPETRLVNTSWRLISYGEPGAAAPVIAETEVTLRLDEDGQAGGSGGCNTFGAEYEVSDGRIAFPEIIATEIACPGEGVMEQEQAYFEALRTAGTFERVDGELRIWYADGQRMLNFVQVEAS